MYEFSSCHIDFPKFKIVERLSERDLQKKFLARQQGGDSTFVHPRPITQPKAFSESRYRKILFFGGYSEDVTPVPIPNTEVKLFSADGTAREAWWESRTPPKILYKACHRKMAGFFIAGFIRGFVRGMALRRLWNG